jgi:hypothetical protein
MRPVTCQSTQHANAAANPTPTNVRNANRANANLTQTANQGAQAVQAANQGEPMPSTRHDPSSAFHIRIQSDDQHFVTVR